MKAYLFTKQIIVLALIFCIAVVAQNTRNDRYEYRGNTRVNTRTKIVGAMYNVNSKIYNGTAEQIARQFLEENKTAFGISDIADMKFTEVIESPAGQHVGFLQTYKGIPVFGSDIVVSINKENRVSMVVNGNTPITGLKSTTAGISKNFAVSKAIAKVNAEEKTLVMQPKSGLYIYQDSSGNSKLTWKINFITRNPHGDWQVFVDANSGEVINVMDIAMHYVNGTGTVFKPDPITALPNTYLTDQNNSDYPALQSAYDTVTLNNLNDAVGGVYRLQGKYARSEEIIEIPNTTPVTSATTSFLYNRSQPGFEETNAYYFIDAQRQYIGGLGCFSPQWNNQDYIRFDAHGGTTLNDCWYDPDDPRIIFGDHGIDDAEDQDVILHEYGHALHDALMTGIGMSGDEDKISEGVGDYLALSYRRTLSNVQQDHIFNWDGLDWGGRSLNSSYVYSRDWTSDKYRCGTLWASTMMDIETSTGIGRDVATKLLLTSISYVNNTSTVLDHVYAILQADRNVYNGSHLLQLANVFFNRGFLYYKTVISNVTVNDTWDGIVYVVVNSTVNSNVTLTISQNSLIIFDTNGSLTVNGTLTANGNSSSTPITFYFGSPNSSTQNGIVFNSGSSGTINYCQIRNAYRGIYENGASVNITNTAISGCTDGIYLYNSNPTIQGCNIHNNSNAGINMLYCSTSPFPLLKGNYIQYNQYGVYCSTNSTPTIGISSSPKGNYISGNSYGVLCCNNANPNIGNTSSGGYNNLLNTTYNVLNTTGNIVYARNNWWGTPPSYKVTPGNVTYTPNLSDSVIITRPTLSKTNGNLA